MMRSIFVLLCCSLLLFVFVWQANPEFIARMVPSFASRIGQPAPSVPMQTPIQKVESKKPAATSAKATPLDETAAPETAVLPELPAPIETLETPAPVAQIPKPAPVPSVFIVSSEGDNLYLSNSSDSKVLRILKKGEIVKPQYQFNNQGQEWMFVSLSNPATSGFIRSGNIEKKEVLPPEIGE